MDILTNEGKLICSLPETASCQISKITPEDMELCPLKKFDEKGFECRPEKCEFYKET